MGTIVRCLLNLPTAAEDKLGARHYTLAAALIAILSAYCLAYERSIFGLSATMAIIAFFALVTGRLLFPAVLVATTASTIVSISAVKHSILQVAFMLPDIILVANPEMFFYMWSSELTGYMTALTLVLVASGVLLGITIWRDRTKIRRKWAALALLISLVTGYLSQTPWLFEYFGPTGYLETFYVSVVHTAKLALPHNRLFEIGEDVSLTPFSPQKHCTPDHKPPNIVLIHQESVFPPSHIPSISYDKSIVPFFRSFDGRVHKLRVEVFAYSSWLSQFSVLTGLSSASFGKLQLLADFIMTGKLGDTLPQALHRCGYRNIEFSPAPAGFAFTGTFNRSIGFDEIFDQKRQKAQKYNERDRFYYINLLDEMEHHFSKDGRPLFTFISTQATHFPYGYTYAPEEGRVSGGDAPGVAGMNEYLRRVGLAFGDYQFFLSELGKRFPDQRFLIVSYGDHQPMITEPLISALEGDGVPPLQSLKFMTYYSVVGISYAPPQLPKVEVLDIPYLASLVPFLARLPLSEAHAARLDLLQICSGRYAGCSEQEKIAAFQRRLVLSGLLKE